MYNIVNEREAFMKFIDKFLKKLNVSRNTFATYIFTLITVYLAVDRIVEMLLMIFTGVAVSYWGPITYTFALACPILAFLFSGHSAFATSKNHKITLFYLYVIGLIVYFIIILFRIVAQKGNLKIANYTLIITYLFQCLHNG